MYKKYPKVDNDLLMLAASFKRSPSAPEVFCLLKMEVWLVHAHTYPPKRHLVPSI